MSWPSSVEIPYQGVWWCAIYSFWMRHESCRFSSSGWGDAVTRQPAATLIWSPPHHPLTWPRSVSNQRLIEAWDLIVGWISHQLMLSQINKKRAGEVLSVMVNIQTSSAAEGIKCQVWQSYPVFSSVCGSVCFYYLSCNYVLYWVT